MTPLLIISSYSGFLGGQLMIAMQKEKLYMWCMISAAVCDIILNLVFIPHFGAFGAATATFLTEVFIFIMYTFLLRNFLEQINLKKHILQCVFATVIMGIAIVFEYRILKNDFIRLIAVSVLGIIIYFSMLFALKNDFLKQLLSQVLSKLKRK